MILQYYNKFIALESHEDLQVVSSENVEKLLELDYKTFITTIYILEQYEANII